jgi:putative transposase
MWKIFLIHLGLIWCDIKPAAVLFTLKLRQNYFSKNRDKKAATKFFIKAMKSSGKPTLINIDKSGSNISSLNEINRYFESSEKIEVRQSKYLNNRIEQDHRFIKKIVKPMLGFKFVNSASATLTRIELHHMLRKKQHINSDEQSIFEQFYALAGELCLEEI